MPLGMEICDCCIHCLDDGYISSGDECEDRSASSLSHVGRAAYDALRRRHNRTHHKCWNVTSGVVVGHLHQTPLDGWTREVEYEDDDHDDWFPKRMGELMKKTTAWCDIMTLAPPDGIFLTTIQESLAVVAENSKNASTPVIVRIMLANLPGMPVNCDKLIKKMCKNIPDNANMHVWLGAWRRGSSWNHAKLIAVDGEYLQQGGHNMWSKHYLADKPVHDLSMELQGRCAHDGHRYANEQWFFIRKKQSTPCGAFVDKLPDGMPLIAKTRVTVSEFPEGKADIFPPPYFKTKVPRKEPLDDEIPLITVGRYGTILRFHRPSDDAFLAMFMSAKKFIRLAVQDIGPVCIPGTKIPLPGLGWPKPILRAIAAAIYQRKVVVEIAMSSPGSIPSNCSPTEAQYGNGWDCVDVAAVILKQVRKLGASESELRSIFDNQLRVCFVRQKHGRHYDTGMTIGMHAKHFIIDDRCSYIGSQNIYPCDLAEWGVIIDHEGQTKKFMQEYWTPLWEASFTGDDAHVNKVMSSLDKDYETTKPPPKAPGGVQLVGSNEEGTKPSGLVAEVDDDSLHG